MKLNLTKIRKQTFKQTLKIFVAYFNLHFSKYLKFLKELLLYKKNPLTFPAVQKSIFQEHDCGKVMSKHFTKKTV